MYYAGSKGVEGVDKESLIKYLKEKLERLEEEIKVYKSLLAILTSSSEEIRPSKQAFTPDKVKVITVDDDVIANLVRLDSDVRIMLRETIPTDNELLHSFLIPFLKDKKEIEEIEDYDIRENKGFITEIVVRGVKSDSTVREIEIALKYLWKSLHKK